MSAWGSLIAASALAAWLVPEWPFAHLDDPSHWGVIGYFGLVALLAIRRGSGWGLGSSKRRMITAFLVGLPVIYVADWARFGGSAPFLAIEFLGLALWWWLAWLSRRHVQVLWIGCVAHAAWDAAHLGRTEFVPDWYALACVAADVGVGVFVAIQLRTGDLERTAVS